MLLDLEMLPCSPYFQQESEMFRQVDLGFISLPFHDFRGQCDSIRGRWERMAAALILIMGLVFIQILISGSTEVYCPHYGSQILGCMRSLCPWLRLLLGKEKLKFRKNQSSCHLSQSNVLSPLLSRS